MVKYFIGFRFSQMKSGDSRLRGDCDSRLRGDCEYLSKLIIFTGCALSVVVLTQTLNPPTPSIQKGILPPQAQQKIADLPGW